MAITKEQDSKVTQNNVLNSIEKPGRGHKTQKLNYKLKRILIRVELDAFLEVVEQDEVWRDSFQTELMTGLSLQSQRPSV